MGSYLLGDEDVRQKLLGKRIVDVYVAEDQLRLITEDGYRLTLEVTYPRLPDPMIEVWCHGDRLEMKGDSVD